MPGSGFSGGSTGTRLGSSDLAVIEGIRGVNLAGGMTSKVARVEAHGDGKYTFVIGIPTDKRQKIIEEMEAIKIAEGRFFNDKERYGAGVGYLVAHGDFFDKPVGIGDRITINGRIFRVIGTLEKIGSKQDDEQVYMPLETFEDIFDDHDNYVTIMAQVKEGFVVSEVAEDIKEELREYRDVREGEEDFTVQTTEQMMESFGTVLTAIRIVFLGIAGISLLVGGVGIMNTMYTSVLQRTREIGVMKAVGARNRDILGLFLVESGIVGAAGGLVGIVAGLALSKLVEYLAVKYLYLEMLKAHVSVQLVLGALAFSFIVGCIAGVLPAKQAAELSPVEALRYE
jgi:putative ABC transport system permease protein